MKHPYAWSWDNSVCPWGRDEDRAPIDLDDLAERVGGAICRGTATSPPVVRPFVVAGWLGIGERAVRKMMDRGELPWIRKGRQRFVPLDLLRDQLAAEARANLTPPTGG